MGAVLQSGHGDWCTWVMKLKVHAVTTMTTGNGFGYSFNCHNVYSISFFERDLSINVHSCTVFGNFCQIPSCPKFWILSLFISFQKIINIQWFWDSFSCHNLNSVYSIWKTLFPLHTTFLRMCWILVMVLAPWGKLEFTIIMINKYTFTKVVIYSGDWVLRLAN